MLGPYLYMHPSVEVGFIVPTPVLRPSSFFLLSPTCKLELQRRSSVFSGLEAYNLQSICPRGEDPSALQPSMAPFATGTTTPHSIEDGLEPIWVERHDSAQEDPGQGPEITVLASSQQ